ncbi:MAG: hypothetical protein IJ999_04860 [Clostridia bacterium]|nr:hypothetical protein [Clostridia bacterium]
MKKFVIALLALVMIFSMSMFVACGECEHDWKVTANTATCTADGTKTFTCSLCDETKTEPSQKTGHDMGEYVVTTEAVCATNGVKTATCKNGCGHTETKTIMAPGHNIYAESCRILYWNGSGNNINYHSVCQDCGEIDTADSSLGNYRTLDKLFAPLESDKNAIFSFHKVVYVYNYDVSFSIMKDAQLMEIGQADKPARSCTIDVAASTTGAEKATIAGDIVVVNGKLTINGPVDFSGSIVVKAGSTLEISEGATIANSGSITVEAGATLINNGTVTGNAIA